MNNKFDVIQVGLGPMGKIITNLLIKRKNINYMKVLIGKYNTIASRADIGKVNNHIATIFHNPFFMGAPLAFDNPTNEATSI